MYYLQSRYYDPALKRFINADRYLSTGSGFTGFNAFAYCLNDPVDNIDENGEAVRSGIPPRTQDGYEPPKGGPKKGRDKHGKVGWVDKHGNVWVPVPDGSPAAHGGGHWDVQRPDGRGYVNRYPGGNERPGSGKRPNIPEPANYSSWIQNTSPVIKSPSATASYNSGYSNPVYRAPQNNSAMVFGAMFVIGCVATAFILAPATGGASLVLAFV